MVIKNPPKISPGLIFGGGGAYYRDDICVKNQGGLFSGGGGGLLSGFYGMCIVQIPSNPKQISSIYETNAFSQFST